MTLRRVAKIALAGTWSFLRRNSALAIFSASLVAGTLQSSAQSSRLERTYPQSKNVVQRALKELQPSLSGRLPALEGFANPGDHPLSQYQRAYFQSAVEVSSTPSGGSVVHVSTKVTAWYADANASRSGYRLLTSNGRLESDLLDQLSDLLADNKAALSATVARNDSGDTNAGSSVGERSNRTSPSANNAPPAISAPVPRSSENSHAFPSISQGLSAQQLADSKNALKPTDAQPSGLQAEAASLEQVLKNQAHPKNLVAIKKTGTPVVGSPSLSGKTLFLASAHDEFEMLDFNEDWVHVRISGLSRGWIWRTSLEMPQGISDVPTIAPGPVRAVADLFQISREETAPFPGDWEPLRGKNVKIISVQKIQENEKDSGAQAKLEFAKSLLRKNYKELAEKSSELAGIVFIFDSVDGGMIAATLPTVQQWKAGTLSDAALWHQCYFDPPETFSLPTPAGGS